MMKREPELCAYEDMSYTCQYVLLIVEELYLIMFSGGLKRNLGNHCASLSPGTKTLGCTDNR